MAASISDAHGLRETDSSAQIRPFHLLRSTLCPPHPLEHPGLFIMPICCCRPPSPERVEPLYTRAKCRCESQKDISSCLVHSPSSGSYSYPPTCPSLPTSTQHSDISIHLLRLSNRSNIRRSSSVHIVGYTPHHALEKAFHSWLRQEGA